MHKIQLCHFTSWQIKICQNQGWQNFEQSCFVHSFEHAQNALHKILISCSMLKMNAQNPIMSFYQLTNKNMPKYKNNLGGVLYLFQKMINSIKICVKFLSRLMSAPATSVSLERIFSTFEYVQWKLRNRLKLEKCKTSISAIES